jgi:ABC-2 type transport system permease protein
MRLVLEHARATTIELARYPAYLVPTLVLPTVFFLFFAAPAGAAGASVRMATFAGFAAIGVAFFQFGVGIAVERVSPWETFLRTLPIGPGVRLGARVLSAGVFATAAAGLLLAVAVTTTPASLSVARWIGLVAALLVGTVPFALLGIALGYWAPARGALPIANLLYLALSYAGGLWIRPSRLPDGVAGISRFLPTRAFADVLIAPTIGGGIAWGAWATLVGFAALFAVCARWGYRRDEGRRYR